MVLFIKIYTININHIYYAFGFTKSRKMPFSIFYFMKKIFMSKHLFFLYFC